jgi:serine/threonine protein kinase
VGAASRAARLPNPGELVGTKYRIVRALGAGGMGVVYEAEHVTLGNRVALKILLPEMIEQEETVTRFEREARASGTLRGPHVAHVTDVDKTQQGLPFMVMDFLEGHDLSAELEARGRLPIDEAVDYILQACDAMIEAHGLGIIHRDLKPSNLFVVDEGGLRRIKVLDFGISKIIGDDAHVTMTEISFGTPLYMSPEQVRSTKHVDARTDIWSMGVILFELLSGRTPFLGSTTAAAAAIVADRVPSLMHFRPELPQGLEDVVLKSLEKDASNRFASVEEFVLALKPFAPAEAIQSDPALSAIARTPLGSVGKLKFLPGGERDAETFVRPSDKRPGPMGRPTSTAAAAMTELNVHGRERSRSWKPWALVASAIVIVGGAAAWTLRPPAIGPINAALTSPGISTPVPSTLPSADPPASAAAQIASASPTPSASSAKPVPAAARGIGNAGGSTKASYAHPAPAATTSTPAFTPHPTKIFRDKNPDHLD